MQTRREFLRTTAGLAAAASFRIAHAGQSNTKKDAPNPASPAVVETVLGPLDVSKLGFTLASQRGGETQAAILEAEGVSPARVSLGHSDDTTDVNYLIGLAKRGYTIGIDHIFYGATKPAKGEPDFVTSLRQIPWQQRAGYVKRLIDAGFGDRIFLSQDWELEREQMNPDAFLFNTRHTIPYLAQLGVSPQQIHAITVDNPKRFFARS